ncbi:substrate-binding domain-containing protein [Chakrabartyella piscis]|uniref:substrate-binding domain-containing protein n=1 Tax=Chakrabartyella piscis TaxID=2918914 RepID=UPI0029588665|nr:substrate-binding domain-containing protein [Chakrabartyella piscis]
MKYARKLLSIVLAGAMVLSMTACSSSSTAETTADSSSEAAAVTTSSGDSKGNIVGIYKLGTMTWFIEEGAASGQVVTDAGYNWKFLDCDGDAATYMELLNTVIADKVDGVLVCLPDQNLSQVTVEMLDEAGIPVIAVDDALQEEDGTKIAPWVGIDAYNIGRSVGEWAVDYILDNDLKDDESFGILYMTAETVSSCVPRTVGEREAIAEGIPDFPESRQFFADCDTSAEDGNQSANAVVTGHPEITKWLVIGVSDESSQGAARAIESAGLGADSMVVGLGAYLCPDEFENEDSCFKAAAYFSARDIGGTAATKMIDYLENGTEIPAEYAVGATIVEKGDDLAAIMPEYIK